MSGVDRSELVRWEELLPAEFLQRIEKRSLVYLPMGICEPHGHIAPLGLDTLKAEYLCLEAARRFGGIVAPTLGYQIHEVGFHAQWLEEVVGEVNPRMTAMPPDVMMRFFLFQLRAFANAGFKVAFALTGHAGGNQEDFRLVATHFMKYVDMEVLVKADPELVEGKYEGDHAGRYEISQLLYLRPELMDLSRLELIKTSPLGRFAQGQNAAEASAKEGADIIKACLEKIGQLIPANDARQRSDSKAKMLDYGETEQIWDDIVKEKSEWITLRPHMGQPSVKKDSRWLPFERP